MSTRPAARRIAVLHMMISHGTLAGGIDLDCETLSARMIDRLDAEGLLLQSDSGRQRALAVSLELCSGAEASAQEQHETGKQEALDNWLFEERPDKAGNRRLKNLKR